MTIKEIKEKINNLITNDTSKEDIDKIAGISSDLDELDKSMEESNKAYNTLKDDYINLIKNRNINNNLSDDINKKKEEDTPTDLESIAKNVIANRKK